MESVSGVGGHRLVAHRRTLPETCGGCPFRNACPINKTRDGRYTMEFSDKDHRLAGRRREQETPVFTERYARRSGIESTNSGLKNRLGLKRLRVRGRGSVFRVILHKLAGWNVLRAAASKKMRAWVSVQVAQTLKGGGSGPIEEFCAPLVRPSAGFQMVFRSCHGGPHGFTASRAA